MGMTIDKTIEFFNGLECYTPQAKDARDVAIETMRKYQKIEQIVDRPTGTYYSEKAYNYMMIVEDIREVLEDGQNTIKD